jgi:putative endonuclease
MEYFVYLLECADKTFYCGYTTDIENRVKIHNTSKYGAKYTSGRRPVRLKYFEKFPTKSEALKREYQIKKLTREEKEKLINV